MVEQGFDVSQADYDLWFRAKVKEALDDREQTIAHRRVMDEAQALIDKRRRKR